MPPETKPSVQPGPIDVPAPSRRCGSRWTLHAHRLAGAAVLTLALSSATPASAQTADPAPVYESTPLSSLPDETGGVWSRIGTAPTFVIGDRLICNDNSTGAYVAYQGMLGQIEAEHTVTVRTSMDVISNIGGQGAVIEISRPGLELIVQLFPDRVTLVEREDRGLRFIATATATLEVESEVMVRKASSREDGRETLTVWIDGNQVLRGTGSARGQLGIGRVIFGSLGYQAYGATRWSWIEVEAVAPDVDQGSSVPTEGRSFGSLKSEFLR